MRRAALGGLCALALGCAGAPVKPITPPLDGLPHAAVQVRLQPARLDQQLGTLEHALASTGDALGPLGKAWQRTRQHLADALAEWVQGAGPSAPTVLSSWGIAPHAPLWIWWGAADERQLPHQLVAQLSGRAIAPPPPVWQGRVLLHLEDGPRLIAALSELAQRLSWSVSSDTQPQRWAATLVRPSGVRWWAWDAQHHRLIALRVRGARAVVDVLQHLPGAAPQPRRLGVTGGVPLPSERAIAAWLEVGGLIQAQGAVTAALGLAPTAGASRAVAVAEVLADCTSRLADAARLVHTITLGADFEDARPQLRYEAQLTPQGQRWWQQAVRPTPMRSLRGHPAGFQVGLSPTPGGPAEPQTLRQCPGLSPPLLQPLLWALAPAWVDLSALPLVHAPGQAAQQTQSVAALVLHPQGAPLSLASVTVGAPVFGDAPLGPNGIPVADAAGQRWLVTTGGPRVHLANRTVHGQPARLYALGDHALQRVDAALGGTEGPWLEARFDATALAAALVGTGEASTRAALRALGRVLGPLMIRGQRTSTGLHLELTPADPANPRANLDQRPPAK